MCCEHKVRNVKELLKSFHNQLEMTLIMKSVMAQNSTSIIKDHFYDCLGKGDFKSGGGHRHEYFNDDEKQTIKQELRRLNMFSNEPNRTIVLHNIKIRKIWEDLSDENIDIFLDRNCRDYKLKRTYRYN